MATLLAPLKKSPLEKPLNPFTPDPTLGTEAMPEISAADQAFQANQEAQLNKSQDQLIDQNLSGASQAGGQALSGPPSGGTGDISGDVISRALAARAQRQYGASENNLLQKQRLAAPGKQMQNTSELLGQQGQDLKMLQMKAKARELIEGNAQGLSEEDRNLAFQQHMEETQSLLNEKHRRLSEYVAQENKRRQTVAAKNAIIVGIMQAGGTVLGGIIGGPAGAIGGGAIGGSVAPNSSTQTAQMPMPQTSQYGGVNGTNQLA